MLSLYLALSLFCSACGGLPGAHVIAADSRLPEFAQSDSVAPAAFDFQLQAKREARHQQRQVLKAEAQRPKPLLEDLSIEVAGWYNDGWDDESHAVYTQHQSTFSEVNPYWYNLGRSDSGSQAKRIDGSVHERAYVYSPAKREAVHQAQDLVIPTVGDNARGQINRILASPTARLALLNRLTEIAVSRNYDGLDLNFELGEAQGQQAFAVFVNDLAQRLHAEGKRLSVTLKAAYSPQSEKREIFNYRLLGQTAVDRFKVMMYDHNFDAGRDVPGPIAEYQWIVHSLRYMIAQGLPAEKMQLGIHNYAWVWKQTSAGQYQMQFPHSTWAEVSQHLSQFNWDTQAQESWGDYQVAGVNYRTYVGDANTVAARIGLVKSFGLAGVVFWTLGREDQGIYSGLVAQVFKPDGISDIEP